MYARFLYIFRAMLRWLKLYCALTFKFFFKSKVDGPPEQWK